MNTFSACTSAAPPFSLVDDAVHATDDDSAVLRAVRVSGRSGEWLLLDDPAGRAQRAAGCVLAPDVGDRVLIWAPASNHASDDGFSKPCAYVLTVLARGGAPRAALALPGGVVLEAGADGLRIDAPRIAIAARAQIDIDAPRIDLSAQDGRLRVEHLDARAKSIDGRANDIRLVARRFTATIDRVLHTLGHCFRRVRGVDDTHAGRVRWQVDERAYLHANDVTLLADRHVGIDGERIHLG